MCKLPCSLMHVECKRWYSYFTGEVPKVSLKEDITSSLEYQPRSIIAWLIVVYISGDMSKVVSCMVRCMVMDPGSMCITFLYRV